MKCISSIKLENGFCDWLGQGAFYRDDFGSLAEKCGLQKWNLGTFQFIGPVILQVYPKEYFIEGVPRFSIIKWQLPRFHP